MSFADIKLKQRRAIHGRLAVSVSYIDDAHPTGLIFPEDYTGLGLTARFHNKLAQAGDLDGDYAHIIDGIERLVFLDENVEAVSELLVANGEEPLVLARGARVTISAYKGLTLELDSLEPPDGPLETVWTVARLRA